IEFFLKHLVLLLTKLYRPNMNGLKLFPNFMSHFLAMDTRKDILTKSIKQSILGSSMVLNLVFTPITNNRFFGDLPTYDMESLKVTRHAGFSIVIISSISLGGPLLPGAIS